MLGTKYIFLLIPLCHFINAEPEHVTIAINTQEPKAILNERYVSFTISPKDLLKEHSIRHDSNQTITLLRSLIPAYLRLDATNEGSNSATGSHDKQLTQADWDQIRQILQTSGLDVISCIPPSPEIEESNKWDLKQILKVRNNLGNQQMGSTWQYGCDLRTLNSQGGVVFGQKLNKLRHLLDSLTQHDDSKLVGPDINAIDGENEVEEVLDFLVKAGPSLSAISWQPRWPSSRWMQISGKKLGDVVFPPDHLKWDRQQLQKVINRTLIKKGLWISEPSSKNTNSFAEGLIYARRLALAVQNGVEVLLKHPNFIHTNQPDPEYWIALLHKKLMAPTVLNTQQIANHSELSTVAQCLRNGYEHDNSGGVTVYVINTGSNEESINLQGIFKDGDTNEVHQYILHSGPEKQSIFSRDSYLNERILKMDNQGRPPKLVPKILKISSGQSIIQPPFSLGFWVLPNAKVKICQEKETNEIHRNINLISHSNIDNENIENLNSSPRKASKRSKRKLRRRHTRQIEMEKMGELLKTSSDAFSNALNMRMENLRKQIIEEANKNHVTESKLYEIVGNFNNIIRTSNQKDELAKYLNKSGLTEEIGKRVNDDDGKESQTKSEHFDGHIRGKRETTSASSDQDENSNNLEVDARNRRMIDNKLIHPNAIKNTDLYKLSMELQEELLLKEITLLEQAEESITEAMNSYRKKQEVTDQMIRDELGAVRKAKLEALLKLKGSALTDNKIRDESAKSPRKRGTETEIAASSGSTNTTITTKVEISDRQEHNLEKLKADREEIRKRLEAALTKIRGHIEERRQAAAQAKSSDEQNKEDTVQTPSVQNPEKIDEINVEAPQGNDARDKPAPKPEVGVNGDVLESGLTGIEKVENSADEEKLASSVQKLKRSGELLNRITEVVHDQEEKAQNIQEDKEEPEGKDAEQNPSEFGSLFRGSDGSKKFRKYSESQKSPQQSDKKTSTKQIPSIGSGQISSTEKSQLLPTALQAATGKSDVETTIKSVDQKSGKGVTGATQGLSGWKERSRRSSDVVNTTLKTGDNATETDGSSNSISSSPVSKEELQNLIEPNELMKLASSAVDFIFEDGVPELYEKVKEKLKDVTVSDYWKGLTTLTNNLQSIDQIMDEIEKLAGDDNRNDNNIQKITRNRRSIDDGFSENINEGPDATHIKEIDGNPMMMEPEKTENATTADQMPETQDSWNDAMDLNNFHHDVEYGEPFMLDGIEPHDGETNYGLDNLSTPSDEAQEQYEKILNAIESNNQPKSDIGEEVTENTLQTNEIDNTNAIHSENDPTTPWLDSTNNIIHELMLNLIRRQENAEKTAKPQEVTGSGSGSSSNFKREIKIPSDVEDSAAENLRDLRPGVYVVPTSEMTNIHAEQGTDERGLVRNGKPLANVLTLNIYYDKKDPENEKCTSSQPQKVHETKENLVTNSQSSFKYSPWSAVPSKNAQAIYAPLGYQSAPKVPVFSPTSPAMIPPVWPKSLRKTYEHRLASQMPTAPPVVHYQSVYEPAVTAYDARYTQEASQDPLHYGTEYVYEHPSRTKPILSKLTSFEPWSYQKTVEKSPETTVISENIDQNIPNGLQSLDSDHPEKDEWFLKKGDQSLINLKDSLLDQKKNKFSSSNLEKKRSIEPYWNRTLREIFEDTSDDPFWKFLNAPDPSNDYQKNNYYNIAVADEKTAALEKGLPVFSMTGSRYKRFVSSDSPHHVKKRSINLVGDEDTFSGFDTQPFDDAWLGPLVEEDKKTKLEPLGQRIIDNIIVKQVRHRLPMENDVVRHKILQKRPKGEKKYSSEDLKPETILDASGSKNEQQPGAPAIFVVQDITRPTETSTNLLQTIYKIVSTVFNRLS